MLEIESHEFTRGRGPDAAQPGEEGGNSKRLVRSRMTGK